MTAVDESKQMDFIGQVIGDWEAMASVPVGELLGLSRAMAGSQPLAAGQLASLASRHGADATCVGVNWLRPRAVGGRGGGEALMGAAIRAIPPTIDDLLAPARLGLHRLDPGSAFRAVRSGAILIDTRPEWQRRADGEIPGARQRATLQPGVRTLPKGGEQT